MKWTNSNKYKFSYSFLNVQVGFQKQWGFLLDEEARSVKQWEKEQKKSSSDSKLLLLFFFYELDFSFIENINVFSSLLP